MDNVTHSLLGLLIATWMQPREPEQRRGLLLTALVASNLPDADLVLRSVLSNPQVSYLVHHRGYTHTLAAVIPLAVLTVVGCALPSGPKMVRWKRLLAVAAVALVGHVAADGWNNYGVHPLAPLSHRWFYGDLIFILEPTLWLSVLPFALVTTQQRVLRGVWAVLLGLALTLGWWLPTVRPWSGALIGVWTLGIFLAQRRWQPLKVATVGVAGVLVGHLAMQRWALEVVLEPLAEDERAQVVDVAMSPGPAAPWCWSIQVGRLQRSERRWTVELSTVSLLPDLISPEQCQFRGGGERTATLRASNRPPREAIRWDGEFEGALPTLEGLVASSCDAAALMTFLRMPYWQSSPDGWILGDLRYDFESRLGFSELRLPPAQNGSGECRGWVPPWETPFWKIARGLEVTAVKSGPGAEPGAVPGAVQ